MGGCHLYLGHDGLLQDLGHVRPHYNWSDVLELRLVLTLVLGQGHQSPLVQVLGDGCWIVEQAKDLCGYLLGEPMGSIPRLEDGPIKSIRS